MQKQIPVFIVDKLTYKEITFGDCPGYLLHLSSDTGMMEVLLDADYDYEEWARLVNEVPSKMITKDGIRIKRYEEEIVFKHHWVKYSASIQEFEEKFFDILRCLGYQHYNL